MSCTCLLAVEIQFVSVVDVCGVGVVAVTVGSDQLVACEFAVRRVVWLLAGEVAGVEGGGTLLAGQVVGLW